MKRCERPRLQETLVQRPLPRTLHGPNKRAPNCLITNKGLFYEHPLYQPRYQIRNRARFEGRILPVAFHLETLKQEVYIGSRNKRGF